MIRKLKPKAQKPTFAQRAEKKDREQRILLLIWITIPALIVLSLGLVGFRFYQSNIAVWHEPVAKVNGTAISTDEFVKVLRYVTVSSGGGQDPATLAPQVLSQMVDNQLVFQGAAKLGIEVSQDEVTQELNRILQSSDSQNQSQQDIDKNYKEFLDQSRLSDQIFRGLIEVGLLQKKTRESLTEQNVPKEAEQVHLHIISIDTSEKASQVADRLKNGEDFSAVALEVSLDAGSKSKGGDLGWIPKNVYPDFDQVAFSLEPGAVSDPLEAFGGFFLLKVSEKSDSRPLDDQYRQSFGSQEFDKWLTAEKDGSKIEDLLGQEKLTWAVEKVTESFQG